MTVTIGQVISRARSTLNDEGVTKRWADITMVEYLSDGQRELVTIRPEAYPKTAVIDLIAGTRQSLPADGLALIAATRNMGLAGNVPGRAVREVTRAVIDALIPNWHADDVSPVVSEVVYDDREPRAFYVHPPQPGGDQAVRGSLEATYGATPPELAIAAGGALTNPIVVPDVYLPALASYVVYRALAREASGQQIGKAERHYAVFQGLVEGRTISEQRMNPDAEQDRGRR